MTVTFYTQHKQVSLGQNIKDLLRGWPSWFSELGMGVHFKELTGIALEETFIQNGPEGEVSPELQYSLYGSCNTCNTSCRLQPR